MAMNLRGGGGLRSGGLRQKEDVDPMASVANIADIMLVFACGLMMALVTVWNIDFTPVSQLEGSQLQEIDNPEDMPEDITEAGNAYVEKGTVYQDPTTGKYYMVTEEKDAMNEDLAQNGSSSSSDDASGTDSSTSSSSGSRSSAASPNGAKSSGSGSSSTSDRALGAD